MVYELVIEDLTGLGGPMGTEVVRTIGRELFTSVGAAKEYAEKHYAGQLKNAYSHVPREIHWKTRKNYWTSGDMYFIMYNIRAVKPRG